MATSSKVTLKILINKTEGKVLFAEANKDFVDFLFYILSMPIGSIVKQLVKNKNMVGCLGELYQSIEALSETYMLSNQNKNSVLNPKSPLCPTQILPLQQPDDDNEPKVNKFYTCSSSHRSTSQSYVTDTPNRTCPYCQGTMDKELTFVSTDPTATTTAAAERGFVKDTVSYMVMDNLEVKAMSTISCITLINQFNVKDLGSLEERIVDFGLDESLKLVKASMEINNVLTSVFLGKTEA